MWLGGILSAFIVLSITFAAPKIGVAAAIGLVITGNLVVAAAIDRFGWFGVTPIPLEWTRVVGILLLAGGAALVLRK
jgi:transporter family-2 protein